MMTTAPVSVWARPDYSENAESRSFIRTRTAIRTANMTRNGLNPDRPFFSS